jgi:predicted HicB family RNase H-like nuclease
MIQNVPFQWKAIFMPRSKQPSQEPIRASATIAVNVRLPVDVHERLVQLAAKEYRSLNREMLMLIQEALEARAQAQQPRSESQVE